MAKRFNSIILHSASTTTGNGNTLDVAPCDSFTVGIFGTSTTFTINFYGSNDGENYALMTGYDLNDGEFSYVNNATAVGKIFRFDATGISSFYVKIVSISNGNLTINGSLEY